MGDQRDRKSAGVVGDGLARLRTTYRFLLGERITSTDLETAGRGLRDAVASKAVREKLVSDGRLAADLGLAVGTLSEASVRLRSDQFLITRAGSWFSKLSDDDLIIASTNPKWPIGDKQLPDHCEWHRVIYASMEEVGAVFLGQPAAAMAVGVGEGMPEKGYLRAAGESVGGLASNEPIATAIAESVTSAGVILIQGLGVLAHGRDLDQAIRRMETVNRWCEIALLGASHQKGER